MWEPMKPQKPFQPLDLTETCSCLSSLGNSSRRKDCSQAPEQHWLSYIRPCFSNFLKKTNFKWWRFCDLPDNLVQRFTIHPGRDGCTCVPMLQFDSISFAVSWKTGDLSLLVKTLMSFKPLPCVPFVFSFLYQTTCFFHRSDSTFSLDILYAYFCLDRICLYK